MCFIVFFFYKAFAFFILIASHKLAKINDKVSHIWVSQTNGTVMPTPTETHFKFTEAKIAKLPFADHGKRYTVYDTDTKNLIMRVGEKSKVYYMLKKVNGRTVFTALGNASNTSLAMATQALADAIDIVRHGKNPNTEKKKIRDSITIKDFFNDYYFPRHSKLHKKVRSQQEDIGCFRLYLTDIHNQKMIDIDRDAVARLQQKIAQKSGIYAANHTMRLLRAMYNKAIDWGFVGNNPATRIKLFKEIKRDRFLQYDELPRFFKALSEEPNTMFRNFVMLCLLVGQRRDNMQSIKWADVDLENRIIRIPETKTSKPQVAVLSDQAVSILKEMQIFRTSERLFPSASSKSGHLENPTKMWKSLLVRAKIEDLRIHDLRRTFASYQAINGASNTIIGDSIGDTSAAAVSIYARISKDPVRQSVQAATDTMFELAAQTKE